MKLTLSATIAAILTLLMSAAALAAGNCQVKVFNTSWDCQVAYTGGPGGKFCMEFGDFGHSVHFDEFDSWDQDDRGCTCLDTGTASAPKFNVSASAFECAPINIQSTFQGKVAGSKLTAQASYGQGGSAIFSCTKRSSSCPP